VKAIAAKFADDLRTDPALLVKIEGMVKELFQLVRELRILDERLGYYADSNDPTSRSRASAEITLKGIWVDMVEQGAKKNSMVKNSQICVEKLKNGLGLRWSRFLSFLRVENLAALFSRFLKILKVLRIMIGYLIWNHITSNYLNPLIMIKDIIYVSIRRILVVSLYRINTKKVLDNHYWVERFQKKLKKK
jgi:hypothetical protein